MKIFKAAFISSLLITLFIFSILIIAGLPGESDKLGLLSLTAIYMPFVAVISFIIALILGVPIQLLLNSNKKSHPRYIYILIGFFIPFTLLSIMTIGTGNVEHFSAAPFYGIFGAITGFVFWQISGKK